MRTIGLCMLAVAMMAMSASAATIGIGAGDVAWDQDVAGTDVRIRYDAASDAYYLNEDTTTPYLSGIGSGLSSSSGYERVVEGDGTSYICLAETGKTATLVWTFDFANPIEKVTVQNATSVWARGRVAWSVSTDGGSTWTDYRIVDVPSSGFATDGGAVHEFGDAYFEDKNLTSFAIRATLDSNDWRMRSQIFRTNSGAAWGLDVKASLTPVPEPTTIGLVLAGVAGLLRRRLA